MVIGRGRVARRSPRGAAWGVVIVALIGCHRGGGATGAKATTSCRAVAQATARWVDGAAAAQRDAMLRFAVEVIDLCQAPGLSATTRTCVAAATTAAEARACPALAVVPLQAAAPRTVGVQGGVEGGGVEGGEVDEVLIDDAAPF